MNGILNVNKPKGWTSFDVVAKIRMVLGERRVGHTGTLDPDATGVLVVCVGKATKLVPFLDGGEKEYLATLCLGETTDTYDRTGRVTGREEVPEFKEAEIEEVLKKFKGEIFQNPPPYSAVKYKGERLYNLARKGKFIEGQARKVKIKEIELKKLSLPFLTFRIICSKGTYIRSLAQDFGKKLGCGAHLYSLVRLRNGIFKLEDSINLEDKDLKGVIERSFYTIEQVLSNFLSAVVKEEMITKVRNGRILMKNDLLSLSNDVRKKKVVCIYNPQGNILALAKPVFSQGGFQSLRPIRVI